MDREVSESKAFRIGRIARVVGGDVRRRNELGLVVGVLDVTGDVALQVRSEVWAIPRADLRVVGEDLQYRERVRKELLP